MVQLDTLREPRRPARVLDLRRIARLHGRQRPAGRRVAHQLVDAAQAQDLADVRQS